MPMILLVVVGRLMHINQSNSVGLHGSTQVYMGIYGGL